MPRARPVHHACSSNTTRNGNVLMDIPEPRSEPTPPCIRPSSTVPNATSSRPDVRATTNANARCITLAALTPARRACSRICSESSLGDTRSGRRDCRTFLQFQHPKGAVSSSTSPAAPRSTLRALRDRAEPRLAPRIPERRRHAEAPRHDRLGSCVSVINGSRRLVIPGADGASTPAANALVLFVRRHEATRQRRAAHVQTVVSRVVLLLQPAPTSLPAGACTCSSTVSACRCTTCSGS